MWIFSVGRRLLSNVLYDVWLDRYTILYARIASEGKRHFAGSKAGGGGSCRIYKRGRYLPPPSPPPSSGGRSWRVKVRLARAKGIRIRAGAGAEISALARGVTDLGREGTETPRSGLATTTNTTVPTAATITTTAATSTQVTTVTSPYARAHAIRATGRATVRGRRQRRRAERIIPAVAAASRRTPPLSWRRRWWR